LSDTFRQLPQIHALLESNEAAPLVVRYGRGVVAHALRARVDEIRSALRADRDSSPPDFLSPDFFAGVEAAILSYGARSLRRVINATGIIIHTNIGRALLAPEALEAIQNAGQYYSNLELDLATGRRSSRHAHVEALLCELTGAEAAIVVNNCAAAVLACLTCLGAGREVVASRGELIEIGGSFRMPDVIVQSGARLREVGATNKTRLADYEAAIGPETAVLLRSHTSNFRIIGFTARPSRRELAELAHRKGVVMMEDLGSGVLIDLSRYGLVDEPVVGDILKEGVDLVTFSGDKLLGGPQCGVIAGRGALVGKLKTHPIVRALRIDKLSLAALEATLRLYKAPNDPLAKIPVLRALSEDLAVVGARAERLAGALASVPGLEVEVVESTAYAGGGALPQQDLRSFAVVLRAPSCSAQELASRARTGDPAILGRIRDGSFHLDVRAIHDNEIPDIGQRIEQALAP
jgi:L-seryl-tRNA(Ser) seleniumtransferase